MVEQASRIATDETQELPIERSGSRPGQRTLIPLVAAGACWLGSSSNEAIVASLISAGIAPESRAIGLASIVRYALLVAALGSIALAWRLPWWPVSVLLAHPAGQRASEATVRVVSTTIRAIIEGTTFTWNRTAAAAQALALLIWRPLHLLGTLTSQFVRSAASTLRHAGLIASRMVFTIAAKARRMATAAWYRLAATATAVARLVWLPMRIYGTLLARVLVRLAGFVRLAASAAYGVALAIAASAKGLAEVATATTAALVRLAWLPFRTLGTASAHLVGQLATASRSVGSLVFGIGVLLWERAALLARTLWTYIVQAAQATARLASLPIRFLGTGIVKILGLATAAARSVGLGMTWLATTAWAGAVVVSRAGIRGLIAVALPFRIATYSAARTLRWASSVVSRAGRAVCVAVLATLSATASTIGLAGALLISRVFRPVWSGLIALASSIWSAATDLISTSARIAARTAGQVADGAKVLASLAITPLAVAFRALAAMEAWVGSIALSVTILARTVAVRPVVAALALVATALRLGVRELLRLVSAGAGLAFAYLRTLARALLAVVQLLATPFVISAAAIGRTRAAARALLVTGAIGIWRFFTSGLSIGFGWLTATTAAIALASWQGLSLAVEGLMVLLRLAVRGVVAWVLALGEAFATIGRMLAKANPMRLGSSLTSGSRVGSRSVIAGVRMAGAALCTVSRTFLVGLVTLPLLLVEPVRMARGTAHGHVLSKQRLASYTVSLGFIGAFAFGATAVLPDPTFKVEHWVAEELTRERLLQDMASEFNAEGHRAPSGQRIEVVVRAVSPQPMHDYLVARALDSEPPQIDPFADKQDNRSLRQRALGLIGLSGGSSMGDPTLVTPPGSHWLATINHAAGQTVVDLASAQSLAESRIGIVTYEEMSRCLGWSHGGTVAFEDLFALREEGWGGYPCAQLEWGSEPQFAFTDPGRSGVGRSMLLALHSIATGVAPGRLTEDLVTGDSNVNYQRRFQGLIDHYSLDTASMLENIRQGPRFGHFFIMPSDALAKIEREIAETSLLPIEDRVGRASRPMVMVYPQEGAVRQTYCACLLNEVTDDQSAVANEWIAFLLSPHQQQAFAEAGFETGPETAVLDPTLVPASVMAAIDAAWEEIRRPAIVTLVVDTSGSMLGTKMEQAKQGLAEALQAMAPDAQVGFVSFADAVHTHVDVAPLETNRAAIGETVAALKPGGETTLYDAIRRGIEMTDAAHAGSSATRAVVVLTDGQANRGTTGLHDLIAMESVNEQPIRWFDGFEDGQSPVESNGSQVAQSDIFGAGLKLATQHDVQVFFIGVGGDVNLEVGRLLAEATGAEFQGVAGNDLANVLRTLSGYF